MAHGKWIAAFSLIAAASPLAANQPEPGTVAPAGGPETRYCMRVEPATGSRIETIECWTRAQWAEQEVDVDKEWAKEGVRVI
ncbi:MAG TPA: hypothetical protein VFO12_07945 [Sphingomicrobium sp.]|nr:hypothetical protein [Sphingomicrobium sp.]